MRGCPAPAGRRADALTNPVTSSHTRCAVSARGPAGIGKNGNAAVHSALAPGGIRHRRAAHNGFASSNLSQSVTHVAAAAPSSSPTSSQDSPLSPEEEAAYLEFMQQRKAERKAWKMEVRRRAKFDPMATPGVASHQTAQPAGGSPPPNGAAAAPPPPPLPALSRPKAPPAAAASAPPSRLPQPPPAASATAAHAAGIVDLAASRNAIAAKQAAAAVAAGVDSEDDDFLDPDDIDDDNDGGLDLGGVAAMARRVLDEPDGDGEEATAAVPLVSTRPAPPPVAARRPGAPAPKRQLMPIAALQRQRAAAAAAAAAAETAEVQAAAAVAGSRAVGGATPSSSSSSAPAVPAGQQEQDDDELDWDALQAYEKYEQYVNEVTEEEERAARAAARRAASAAATTSTSTPSAKPAAAAPAAGAGASRRRASGAAAPAVADPEDKLDRQLDQWEQLISFFEVVDRDSKREAARKRRMQAQAAEVEAEEEAEKPTDRKGRKEKQQQQQKGGTAAAAATRAAVGGLSLAAELDELGLAGGADGLDDEDEEAQGEVEVDWQSLERLFLGEGWESELADLKAKVEARGEEAARDAEATKQAGSGVQGGGNAEEEVESWRDEVSTLLLGLVEISAKRYLGTSLTAGLQLTGTGTATAAAGAAAGGTAAAAAATASVGEEERAAVFWEAPFLLLVQDDSADPLLEYANRAALAALRLASFDEATGGELTTAALVDPADPRSQQEWLWACSEAAERPERHARIPSLRLRGPAPGSPVILASDVVVFRIDSLEEAPIGQAVLVRSWRQLEGGQEAGRQREEERA